MLPPARLAPSTRSPHLVARPPAFPRPTTSAPCQPRRRPPSPPRFWLAQRACLWKQACHSLRPQHHPCQPRPVPPPESQPSISACLQRPVCPRAPPSVLPVRWRPQAPRRQPERARLPGCLLWTGASFPQRVLQPGLARQPYRPRQVLAAGNLPQPASPRIRRVARAHLRPRLLPPERAPPPEYLWCSAFLKHHPSIHRTQSSPQAHKIAEELLRNGARRPPASGCASVRFWHSQTELTTANEPLRSISQKQEGGKGAFPRMGKWRHASCSGT